jgi:hypothetical protein
VDIERGPAWERGGELVVHSNKRRGWGIVKFIFHHGEASPQPPPLQVAREHLSAFPAIMRELEPTVRAPDDSPERWEWRYSEDHPQFGRRQIVYAVTRFRNGDGKTRLVSIDVQDPNRPGADAADSVFREGAAGASGTPSELVRSIRDTAAGLSRRASESQKTPKAILPQTGEKRYSPADTSVDVRYEVVELDSLTTSHTDDLAENPAFPQSLQPRDRTLADSAAQIQDIASKLRPEQLVASTEAGTVAPIVSPDGLVESGNGRVLALRKAAREGLSGHTAYQLWLLEQGFDLSGLRRPVLTARRTLPLSDVERQAWTRDANRSIAARSGTAERVASDAAALDGDLLVLYQPTLAPDAAGNRDFVCGFLGQLPASEQAEFRDASGVLSKEGVQRVRAALLAKALPDAALRTAILEEIDDVLRAIGAAAAIARLNADMADGLVARQTDFMPAFAEPVAAVAAARRAGTKAREMVQQGQLFGDGLSREGQA